MSVLYYESSFAHYGVKGMKWGVRRYQNLDGSLKPAGLKRNRTILEQSNRKLTSNRFSQGMKHIGSDVGINALYTFVPGAALVGLAISGARGAKSVATRHTNFEKKDGPIEKLSQLKKLDHSETSAESVRRINPSFMGLKTGTEVNCASCAVAMDMRQRGYNIRARRQNNGLTNFQIADLYNTTPKDISGNRKDSPQKAFDTVCNTLSADGDGNSSGVLCMSWKSHYGISSGGHAIYYKSENHNVEFYDAQSGKYGTKLDSYFVDAQPDKFSYIRTDNTSPNESICSCIISSEERRDDT